MKGLNDDQGSLASASEEDSLLCWEAADLFILAELIFFHILFHTPNNQPILLTHSEAVQAAAIVIVMLIFMPSVLFHFALYILIRVSQNLSSALDGENLEHISL